MVPPQVSPFATQGGATVFFMRHLCMRSACTGRAVVLVEMNIKEVSFTIRDLAEVAGPGQVVLCETHVGRLRAPRGWALVDARTVGRLLPFPDSSREPCRPPFSRTVRPGETVRSITDSRHPLDVDRPVPVDRPSASETPLLARAFTGADRHPSTARNDRPDAEVLDPFGDESWDQRDPHDKDDDDGGRDGQMEFDPFDLEPSA